MIRMVHTADLHLDSPFAMLDLQKSEIRRQEIRDSFGALIDLVHSTRVNLLIIAGDLFDGAYVTHETLSMLTHGFESVPECRIVISPGNHDFAGDTGVYKKMKLPSNVYVFDSEEISFFDFPELNCRVYGYAFTSPIMEKGPLCTPLTLDRSKVNILACHADTESPISRYAPICVNDLERAGFDYVALGHIHNSDGVKKLECGGYYAYSGCLEGRGFDEIGEKGVITARLEKSDGKLSFDSKFVPFSKRIYLTRSLDITGCESNTAILAKITAFIKSEGYGERHALKLVLEGLLEPSLRVFTQYLRDQISSLFTLRIIDNTLPLYECAHLEADPSIRGAFFDKLRPLLESEDRETREIASMALRYGLVALAGGETGDIT